MPHPLLVRCGSAPAAKRWPWRINKTRSTCFGKSDMARISMECMCQLFHPWATCQLDVLPCLKKNMCLKKPIEWHRSPLLNWTLPFKPVLKLAISATQLSSQTQESKQTSSSFATKRYGPRICPWGVFGKFIHVRRRHEVIAHKDYEGSKLHTGSYWHIQFYKVHTYMCKWAFLSVKFVIKSNTYYSGLDQKLEYGFEKMQLECGIEGAIRYPAYLYKYLKHSNSYLHDSVCICWSLTAMMSVLSRGTSSLGINRGPACKPPICKRDTKTSI